MSQTIENRIVEMQFENKQFESGVKESLSTLDKLKKALNFDDSAKNLQDLSKATKNFDLNGIGQAVEQVGDKFSTMRLVGIHALNNIVDAAMAAGSKIASALMAPLEQIKSGGWSRAMNIEEAKFQLQGLGIAWQQVSADIDHAVKDTAFGLDSAAKACAQLSASGVQAGEDMKAALRGISGVAAMGNTEYENIAQIFTKAAGNGRVMADELNRISQYGLNASATLAKFYNQIIDGDEKVKDIPEHIKQSVMEVSQGLHVTESDIREFASHSEIDFQTFAYAMDNAFGEHAKKANETFGGALRNIKAALSRTGEKFATPLIQNAIPALNKIRELINAINGKTGLGNIVNVFSNLTRIISNSLVTKLGNAIDFINNKSQVSIHIYNSLRNVAEAVVKVFTMLRDAFRTVFPETRSFGEGLNSITGGLEKLTEKLIPSNEGLMAFRSVMVGVFTIFKAVGTVIKAILPIVGKLLSIAGNILSFLSKIIVTAINFVSQLNLMDIAFSAIEIAAGLFLALIERLKAAFEYLKNVLSDTTTVTGQFAAKIKDAVLTIGSLVGGSLYLAFTKVKEFINNLITSNDPLKYIVDSFKNLVATLKEIPIIENVIIFLERGFTAIQKLISEFMNADNKLQFVIDKMKSLATIIGGTLYSAVQKVITIVKDLVSSQHPIDSLITKVQNLVEKFKQLDFVKTVVDYIKNAFSGLVSIFKPVEDGATKATECVKSLVGVTQQGEKVIKETYEMVEAYGNGPAMSGVEHTLTKTGTAIEDTSNKMTRAQKVLSVFTKLWGILQEKLQGLRASHVVMAIFATRLAVMAYHTDELVQSLTDLAKKLKSGFFNFFKTPLSTFTKFSASVLMVAGSIGILATAFYALKDVPTEQLTAIAKSLGGIIALTGGIALLSTVIVGLISAFGGAGGFTGFAAGMLALSASLIVFLGALKLLDSLDLQHICADVITLVVMIGAFIGVALALSHMPKIQASALSLVAFAGSILIIVKALDNLSQVNFEAIKANWKEIIAVLLGFAAVAAIASTVGISSIVGIVAFFLGFNTIAAAFEKIKEAFKGIKFGEFILEFCSRLKNTISQAVKHLEDVYKQMSTWSKLSLGILTIVGSITAIYMFRAIENTTKYIRRLAFSVTLMAAAIALLMVAYEKVAQSCQSVDKGKLKQVKETLIAIGGFLTVLTGILAFASGDSSSDETSGRGKNKKHILEKHNRSAVIKEIRKMLLDMGILIAAIALFMNVVGKLEPDELIQARNLLTYVMAFIGAISLLMAGIAAASKGTNTAGIGTFLGIIMLMGSLIATFVVAMNYFKNFDPKTQMTQLIATCIAMIALVGAIIGILTALKKVDKGGASKIYALAAVILAFGGVVAAILYISDGDPGKLKMAAAIAGALLVALAAIMGLMTWLNSIVKKSSSSMKKMTVFIGTLVSIIGSVILLAAAVATLTYLSGDNWQSYGKAAAIAGALLAAIAAIIGLTQWLMHIISKNSFTGAKIKSLVKIMTTMVSSIVAIGLTVATLTYLSGDGWQSYGKAAAITGALLGAIAAIIGLSQWLMSNITRYNFAKARMRTFAGIMITMVASIIAIGATVGILVSKLGNDWSKYAKAGAVLLALLAAVTALTFLAVAIVKLVGNSTTWGSLAKAGTSMAAMVVIFGVLALIFYKIDKEFSSNIGQLYAKMGAILLCVLALEILLAGVLVLGALVKGDVAAAFAGGAALSAMVAIFWWLEYVFSKIDGLKTEGIMKKSQTIILVMTELLGLFILWGLLGALIVATGGVAGIAAAVGVVALAAMIWMFDLLTEVFEKIDGLKTEGIMKKSQTIILVMLELEALGLTSILAMGVYAGGIGLHFMIDFFDQLADVFTKIDAMKTEGLLKKSQAIVLVMLELEGLGALSIVDMLAVIGQFGLEPMINFFDQLADVFVKIAGSQVDETTGTKAQQIVDVLKRLEGLGALSIVDILAVIGQYGLEPMIDFFDQVAQIFIKIADSKVDETTGTKAQQIVDVLQILCSMGWDTLSGIVASITSTGVESLVSIFDALTDVVVKIQESGIETMNVEAVRSAFNAIIDIMNSMSEVGGLSGMFKSDMLSGLIDGLTKLTNLSSSAESVMRYAEAIEKIVSLKDALTEMVSSIDTSTQAIIEAIGNMVNSIISTLDSNQQNVYNATNNLGLQMQKAIEALDAKTWGEHLVENLALGIESGIQGRLTSALENLTQTIAAYIEHTNPEKGALAGNMEHDSMVHMTENLADGIEDGTPNVENATDNMMQKAGDAIKSGAHYVTDGFNNCVDTSINFVQQGGDKIKDVAVNAAKSGGDSVLRQLESSNNEALQQASAFVREMFGIYSSLADLSSSYARGWGTFQDYEYQLKTSITHQKNELKGLEAEYQKVGGEATKAGKKIKEDMDTNKAKTKEFETSLANLGKKSVEVQSLTDKFEELAGTGGGKGKGGGGGIQSATDSLAEFEQQLTQTLESQMNIFDKFEKKEAMSKDELLANMQSQIQGMTEWANDMQILSARGLDQGLYKELAMMGPQGAQYVGAFKEMTAAELAQANQLWAQSLVLPKNVAGQITSAFAGIGQGIMQGAQSGVLEGTDAYLEQLDTSIGQGITQTEEQLEINSPSHVYQRMGESIDEGLAAGINSLSSLPVNEMVSVCSRIYTVAQANLDPSFFRSLGKSLMMGLNEGLNDGDAWDAIEETLGKLQEAIEALGGKDDKDDEDKGEPRSGSTKPERVGKSMGKAIVTGMAEGISDNTNKVADAASDMGDATIDALTDTITAIGEQLDNDESLVITPVLDLSNVEEGVKTIDNMFSSNQALNASAALATDLQNGQQNGSQIGGTTFIQNNYSPKALSRVEIYRQTKNQFAQYREALS